MSKTKIICTWSGPRNVSTALMYSFSRRDDTAVIDEPLYAHYLNLVNKGPSGKSNLILSMDNNGEGVIREQIMEGKNKPVLFIKNMAHHLSMIDPSYLAHFSNIFLIRDPEDMLTSLIKNLPNPSLEDTAYKTQYEMYRFLDGIGEHSVVLDARELLQNPETILKKLCRQLKIDFYPAMLKWKPGPIPEAGIWSKYRYENVHETTGFTSYRNKTDKVPDKLTELLDDCERYYKRLFKVALKAN
ncbi:MAG: sulfotransferase family protein [Candidatus Neomarinimicrobiota bacterium]